jgi:Armadillo/beta-catenin-like repeat
MHACCCPFCSFSDDDNKVTIARLGGIDVVVSAMQNHNSVGVQEYASGALRNLIGNVETKELMTCYQALVAAIINHPEGRVQENAFAALHGLITNAGDHIVASTGSQAGDLINIIIPTIQKFSKDSCIHQHTCTVLSFLARQDDNRSRIASSKGIEAVIQLSKFPFAFPSFFSLLSRNSIPHLAYCIYFVW